MSRFFAIAGLLCTLWAPQSFALQAGAAKIEINPALGTPLAGVPQRAGRGARSVLGPLYVRALYLEDEETKLCFVSADLFAITPDLYERVLEVAPSEIPRQNIILSATHTHNGPGGMEQSLLGRGTSGRFMPEVLEATAHVFAEAMREAYEGRRRATVGYKIGDQKALSRNWDDPKGPIDSRLGVLRVDDSDGNAICIVGSLAATPNSIGSDRAFAFSADFPGIFCQKLEEISSRDCVAMFWNGAFGDQRLGNPEGLEGLNRMRSAAAHLAIQVKAIYNVTRNGDGKLKVLHQSFALPPSIAPSMLPQATVLQLVAIDDLLIAFIPGAPYLETAQELRSMASRNGYLSQITVGAANGWLGHFPPLSSYRTSHEDTRRAFYGPDMAQWLVSRVEEMLTGSAPDEMVETSEGPLLSPMGGGSLARFSGSAYQVGLQWGTTFEVHTRKAYEGGLEGLVKQSPGALGRYPWKWAPHAIDKRPIALLEFGSVVRRETMAVQDGVLESIRGTAHATGLPFEAAWLSQRSPPQPDAPEPLVYAVDAERSGTGGALIAVLLTSPLDAPLIVSEIHVDSGHGIAQLGHSARWSSTIAMNDTGLVAVMLDEGLRRFPSASLAVHDALRAQASLETIEEHFASMNFPEGVSLLFADASRVRSLTLNTEGPATRTISRFRSAPSTATRASTIETFADVLDIALESHGVVQLEDLKQALVASVARASSNAAGPSSMVFAAIIFEPAARRYHVAFSNDRTRLTAFDVRTLERDRK